MFYVAGALRRGTAQMAGPPHHPVCLDCLRSSAGLARSVVGASGKDGVGEGIEGLNIHER